MAGHLEEMFAALTAAGAHVVTPTFPDAGKIAPLARPMRSRVFDLNIRIRAAAARHGVAVAETARHAVATDPRLWTTDRLHAWHVRHLPRPSANSLARNGASRPCTTSETPR